MFKIVEKKELVPGTMEFWIDAPLIARKRKAGQFIILRSYEQGERIPLTIADADAEKGTICIIFQVVGKGTQHLADLNEGDEILDLAGPLGSPTDIKKVGKVVCIGGGLGIGPVHPIAQAMKAAGNEVTAIIGARSKDYVIMEDRMGKASDRLIICTDDGSYGIPGFVTTALQQLLNDGERFDEIVAIGPAIMMRAVANMTREYKIPTIVSLNSIMVDGTGMCGACRVTVGDETKFVCVDGPEFDGHKVDFDELMQRLGTYKDEEELAQNKE